MATQAPCSRSRSRAARVAQFGQLVAGGGGVVVSVTSSRWPFRFPMCVEGSGPQIQARGRVRGGQPKLPPDPHEPRLLQRRGLQGLRCEHRLGSDHIVGATSPVPAMTAVDFG